MAHAHRGSCSSCCAESLDILSSSTTFQGQASFYTTGPITSGSNFTLRLRLPDQDKRGNWIKWMSHDYTWGSLTCKHERRHFHLDKYTKCLVRVEFSTVSFFLSCIYVLLYGRTSWSLIRCNSHLMTTSARSTANFLCSMVTLGVKPRRCIALIICCTKWWRTG